MAGHPEPLRAACGSRRPWRAAADDAAALLLQGWWRCRSGTSAIEFALIGPALALSLLASVDLGFALTERMQIDHVLRSGAQKAIEDPGTSVVSDMMRDTAARNFALSNESATPISLSTLKFCACPEAAGAEVTCTTVCTGSEPPFIYYRMTAEKTFAGRLFPDLVMNRSVQVQIR